MLTVTDLSMEYGAQSLFHDVNLQLDRGNRVGIVGANGSGKSSLLRVLCGQETATQGEVVRPRAARVGMLSQDHFIYEEVPILEVVMMGNSILWDAMVEKEALLAEAHESFDDERYGRLEDIVMAHDGYGLEARAGAILEGLGVPTEVHREPLRVLSGGFKLRVLLGQTLASEPDLLLLDEPTNHLDAGSVAWLERFLAEYPGCVVAVTHDRYFMDNVAGWILELDHGKAYPFEGNYTGWLEQKQERMRQEQKAETNRQKSMARELEWIRMSPRARQAKSQARINAYEDLVASGMEKRRETGAHITIPLSKRLGSKVLEVREVTKGYDEKLLIESLTFDLPPGGIVGVIGANGAGKTTLFKMILGEETPDAGELTLGETVDLGYVDQSRDALDDDKSVWESITGGTELLEIGGRSINSRAYVSAFNFKGADQQQKVGTLSGGERNRVHLARLLREGCNVLLLDEPTNDLDVETLRNLEVALAEFPGCAVIISHDRWFLDRLATHILAFEGNSQVVYFEGSYQDYEKDRKVRLGEDAARPKPIKYKKLTR